MRGRPQLIPVAPAESLPLSVLCPKKKTHQGILTALHVNIDCLQSPEPPPSHLQDTSITHRPVGTLVTECESGLNTVSVGLSLVLVSVKRLCFHLLAPGDLRTNRLELTERSQICRLRFSYEADRLMQASVRTQAATCWLHWKIQRVVLN